MKVLLRRRMSLVVTLLSALLLAGPGCVKAQDEDHQGAPHALNEHPMTAVRLGELILAVDVEAVLEEPAWIFTLEGLEVIVVFDIDADRMRIIIPIGPATDVPQEELVRLLQANFDSAPPADRRPQEQKHLRLVAA